MRPVGPHNDNANAAKWNSYWKTVSMRLVWDLGGMGGHYSVMGVNIENTARHPSAIGVAVNVGCWSRYRRGPISYLIKT